MRRMDLLQRHSIFGMESLKDKRFSPCVLMALCRILPVRMAAPRQLFSCLLVSPTAHLRSAEAVMMFGRITMVSSAANRAPRAALIRITEAPAVHGANRRAILIGSGL